MRKLLQELYECERMMKRVAEASFPLQRIPVESETQTPDMPTEPSSPKAKTETDQPAFNPPASAVKDPSGWWILPPGTLPAQNTAERQAVPPSSSPRPTVSPAVPPNSTSVPVAPTSRYPNGFIAATHDTVEGTKVQMVQRPDGTVALLLPDAHGNPQSLDSKSRTAYLRSANWDVWPHKDVPELDGTTYKFHVSPYGITREAIRDGNSTWTQMDPRTGQMRDPDIHFRYPAPEGANTNSMLLQASAPIPKDILMDGSPSLEVRQYWDSSDNTLRYAYYDPATAEILPAESGNVERLRNILVSSPDTRYYELPPHSDGSIEYVYETADGSYARVRGTDGKDKWYRYRQADDPRNRGYFPDEGVPEGLDPTPSPLKPVTVSEDKPAENPSETSADTEKARRAAYIKEHGEKPEWTKETPTESIWSDPTFQSNALTGLGVGLLGGLGGYALTGGQGGLAPWLMLGGGVGAGIGGLSGYNQWNANKTEYDDFLKKQKAWDAGLEAGTPVGTLEDGTPVTREDLNTGKVRVVRVDPQTKQLVYRRQESDSGIDPALTVSQIPEEDPSGRPSFIDETGQRWNADKTMALPSPDSKGEYVYKHTPALEYANRLGSHGGVTYTGYEMPDSAMDYENIGGWDRHVFWVTDPHDINGGYKVYAYPRKAGRLTNNGADYVWKKEHSRAEIPWDDIQQTFQSANKNRKGGVQLFSDASVSQAYVNNLHDLIMVGLSPYNSTLKTWGVGGSNNLDAPGKGHYTADYLKASR